MTQQDIEKKEPKRPIDVRRTREAEEEVSFTPLVDIYEEQDGTTVVVAELPGADPETLDIRVDKGVLNLSAEASLPDVDEQMTQTYAGFTAGRYYRAFALSDEVDRDAIDANFRNGLLTLRLPKAAAAKTRKIEIQTD